METIKDIFQAFGPEYMTRFGDAMPGDHRKVINAIINCRTNHFKAMSLIFKAKFRDLMKKDPLYSQIPSQVWEQSFNVNCQAVGGSERSIKYLAPYVFKIAISDYRIVNVKNRRVSFKYKKSKSNRWRTLQLHVMEFMRRYLQHVLPTGFMKIRYYGFLNPNCRVSLQKISALIQIYLGFFIKAPKTEIKPMNPPTCSICGGNLIYRGSILVFRSSLPTGAG